MSPKKLIDHSCEAIVSKFTEFYQSRINALKMKALETIPAMVLILVWTYTGLDKLIRWDETWNAFHNQTFPPNLAEILSYAVPGVELLIALLLLFSVTRWSGFLSSILLLTIFNTYVGLIWVGAFPRVPCSCAGLIDRLGWSTHFWLNCFLILVGMAGLLSGSKKTESKDSVLVC